MNKSGREKLNLFFSAFLVIGYIVCAYFFTNLTTRVNDTAAVLISVAVFVLFGLVLFYATRVGEGVPVKRFSPIILFVLDLPAFIILLAAVLPAFPLHAVIAETQAVWMLAAIALGYGVPYTFLSGFEMVEECDEDEIVEGGLAQELAEDDEEEIEETEEVADDVVADEQDVEELEAIDGAEETADAE